MGRTLTVARYGIGTIALAIPLRWWPVATDNFAVGLEKDPKASKNIVLDDSAIAAEGERMWQRLPDVIGCYQQHTHQLKLTRDELKLAGDKLAHYEMLKEVDDPCGFYGVAFRDTKTGKVILSMAGVDFTTGLGFQNDMDDMLMCTAGGKISQLEAAQKFAAEIDAAYHVDYLTGHSLGGYLALYLKGSGYCRNAECYTFETPGVTRTMVRNCARIGGVSEETVHQRFQEECHSFAATHNSFNDLGQQPGVALALDNAPNPLYKIYPKDHIYGEMIAKCAEKRHDSLVVRDNDGKSGGPMAITALLLGIAAGCFAPEVKRGIKRVSGLQKRIDDAKNATTARFQDREPPESDGLCR